MNILVTGAAGLIGSELCKQLKSHGHHVFAVDNMSRGTNIPEGEFIPFDLNDKLTVVPEHVDVIYHMAAINGTINFYDRPNEVIENNTRVDLNVFEFAKRCPNLKKFVYASSSEMMSHTAFCPESKAVEIDDISNPRWSYKLSKMVGENYLHNSDIPWVIVRYFNVYGSESKRGHIIHDQIENHKDCVFRVIGPSETRCYTHVEDAVEATIVCADSCQTKEVINIGSEEELTSMEVVMMIAECLKVKPEKYKFISGRRGSAKRRIPDLSTLRKYYPDYDPRDLRSGLIDILS